MKSKKIRLSFLALFILIVATAGFLFENCALQIGTTSVPIVPSFPLLVTPLNSVVFLGHTLQLTAILNENGTTYVSYPSNSNTQNFKWTCVGANTNGVGTVAKDSIDQTGLFTATDVGDVVINVGYTDANGNLFNSPILFPVKITVIQPEAVVVSNLTDSTLSLYYDYDNNQNQGALYYQSVSFLKAVPTPTFVSTDPTDQYLYAISQTSTGSEVISSYILNSPITNFSINYQIYPLLHTFDYVSPLLTPTPLGTISDQYTSTGKLIFDPSGKYAYTANGISNTVTEFNVTNGVLSYMAVSHISVSSPQSIAFSLQTALFSGLYSATATYAYIADSTNNVIYTYQSVSGVLTPTSIAPVTGIGTPYRILPDPDGQHILVLNVNSTPSISAFNQNPSGVLTPYGSSLVFPVEMGVPTAITFHPGSNYFYATTVNSASGTNFIHVYSMFDDNQNPQIALVTSAMTGNNPAAIAVDSTGYYVYVINAGDNTVSQYTSSLAPLTPATFPTGAVPHDITF